MKIAIFEDKYGKILNDGLKDDFEILLGENIFDPFEYKNLLNRVDIILLDNYFDPQSGREQPLGDDFLGYILENINNGEINPQLKIICISDYEKSLLEKYENRNQADKKGLIIGYSGKDIQKIKKILKSYNEGNILFLKT